MKKCLIIGAYGHLGTHASPFLENLGYKVFRLGRNRQAQIQIDLLNSPKKLIEIINEMKIDIILNLASLTNVEECEANIEKAYQHNVQLPEILGKNISSKLLNNRPFLIHISTDQVYSGEGPHKENKPKPLNAYGVTKLFGEKFLKGSNMVVLRTNYLSKSKIIARYTLSDWFVNELKKSRQINAFNDVFFNPLHVNSLCEQIEFLCRNHFGGTYNLGSRGFISKSDLAIYLCKALNLNEKLINITSVTKSNLLAKRPNNMVLSSHKFEKKFKIKLPKIESELSKLFGDYDNEL